MNAEYLLKQMKLIGGQMRTAQKGYFATSGTKEPEKKKQFLNDSKKYEKQFDELLAQVALINL